MNDTCVNSWSKQYQTEGLSGLQIKAGCGRKPVRDVVSDKFAILSTIQPTGG
jgi:hypothetical protein